MFKDVAIVYIFLGNRVSHSRQKTALAQYTIVALPMHHWRQFPLLPDARQFLPENHGNVRQRLGIRIK